MTYNIIPHKKKQVSSYWLVHGVFGFFVLTLCFNTIRLLNQYLVRRDFLVSQRAEVEKLDREKGLLKYRLSYAQTEAYVEERSRELGMHKEGEAVLVGSYDPSLPTIKARGETTASEPIYRAWLRVFGLLP